MDPVEALSVILEARPHSPFITLRTWNGARTPISVEYSAPVSSLYQRVETIRKMVNRSNTDSRRHFWRLSFLLLIVVPFLPEIIIYLVQASAKIVGCQLEQKEACLIGSFSASEVIAFALRIGAGLLVDAMNHGVLWFVAFCTAVAVWIIVSFTALSLGWSRTSSRLLLGFAAALVFAFLPYFGPLLAIENLLNQNCQANEGGVGPCIIFGGHVGTPAHDAVRAGWLFFAGAPIALGAFAIYAAVTLAIHAFSKRRVVTSAQ